METPEPFNVFSHRIDAPGVIGACRDMGCEVHVVGPEDDWREITVLGPKKFLRRRPKLRISHDSKFYDRPEWPGYVAGLADYVSRFTHVPRQAEILRVVRSFRFCLAFPDHNLCIVSDDERVAWVHAVCRQLEGILFLPSMLLDAAGRLLVSANGRFDPAAELPSVPPQTDDPELDEFEPESELEATPPTADRVARRAIALAAVGNRGLIENEGHTLEAPEESRQAMLDWIRDSGVDDELEPEEWEVLQRPFGKLDSREIIDAVWRLEGLAVLLWALGLYELPPYDELVAPSELFELVGIFDPDTARDIIAKAKLRTNEELASYSNHAAMAHWRFRNFWLRPVPVDFVAYSKGCWIGTFDITRFRISGGDVMVGQREISKADPESVTTCQSIAQERHLAINWLVGSSELYSKTDTST